MAISTIHVMLGATTDLPPTLTGGGRNKIVPFLDTGMKLSVSGTNLIVWLPVSTKLLTGQRVWQVGKTIQAIQPDFWEGVQDFDQLIISATYCPEPEQLETDEIKFSGTGSAGSLKYTGKRISKMKKTRGSNHKTTSQNCYFIHPTNLWTFKLKPSFYLLFSEKM